ncbi:MAG TPA: hypothetical protein VFS67_36060 [Polyangiaceae bacterium]|nr:hypothetical protein [Polyangiaceae bacterium]
MLDGRREPRPAPRQRLKAATPACDLARDRHTHRLFDEQFTPVGIQCQAGLHEHAICCIGPRLVLAHDGEPGDGPHAEGFALSQPAQAHVIALIALKILWTESLSEKEADPARAARVQRFRALLRLGLGARLQ